MEHRGGMINLVTVSALVTGLILCGCASVKEAPHSAQEQVLRFEPPTNAAGIYIIRKDIMSGAIKTIEVNVGECSATLAPRTFAYFVLVPAKYPIGDTLINAEAGKNYYFVTGLSLGSNKLIRDEEGQELVRKCKLTGEAHSPLAARAQLNLSSSQEAQLAKYWRWHHQEARSLPKYSEFGQITTFIPQGNDIFVLVDSAGRRTKRSLSIEEINKIIKGY